MGRFSLIRGDTSATGYFSLPAAGQVVKSDRAGGAAKGLYVGSADSGNARCSINVTDSVLDNSGRLLALRVVTDDSRQFLLQYRENLNPEFDKRTVYGYYHGINQFVEIIMDDSTGLPAAYNYYDSTG